MERDAERLVRTTQTEAEGNGNGNLCEIEDEGGREVDVILHRHRLDCTYVRRLRLCPGISGTESGRINFVVDDAFAVTEYYILR